MEDSESTGTAKGSLKDRLHVLTILLRISRKKKLRVNFSNINTSRILKINRMYMFFYTPISFLLKDNLHTNDIVLYNLATKLNNFKLLKGSKFNDVDFYLVKKSKKKKGIDLADFNEQIKVEINKQYNVPKEKINQYLIDDYLKIKNDSKVIFGYEIDEELKQEILKDRVNVDDDLIYIKNLANNEIKDVFLDKDIIYELNKENKSLEKLTKLLENQKKEIVKVIDDIDKFDAFYEKKLRLKGFSSLVDGIVGISIGILTLPFSCFRSFALGTNLIKKSVNVISKEVKIEQDINESKEYKITSKDIDSFASSIKASEFLLDDILKQLDLLKYKIKHYSYKVSDYELKLKKIETIENALSKKKIELKKIEESFEKSKIKILDRSIQ